MEPHGETAVPLLLEQVVGTAVPDLDCPRPVLPGGDRPFEVGVLERVVLDVHRQMPLATAQRDPLRHGPARERTVSLEAEVVVEPPRGVTLDHEPWTRATLRRISERLRGAAAAPLPLVLAEAHLWIVASIATLSLPTGCRFEDSPAQKRFRGRG